MPEIEPRTKAIYVDALDFDSPAERNAFLKGVCGDDTVLRREVESLLAAHFQADGFLSQAFSELNPTINAAARADVLDTQIGPYKLREKIGEGGMGEVYVAEQAEPVRRKVALKIIKPGMASQDAVARFEAERQALAMMDHPSIASVHDGGVTDTGRPFFVMELVRGVPITEFCDRERLSTAERLRLFVKVCRAVQHAHQKGIIHRDIKPTNVLVPEIDGEAVPKIIDFGVAKAVSQKLTDQTVYTQFEQVVGTPLYMSPEQAGSGVVDIDTRSDVYSLGVLLYELLTGKTPFDREALKQSGFDEFRRILREEVPHRPSQAISTLNAEALSTISHRRACDPRKFTHVVRGELDWIAMKALEKDRSRRYETASGLARDIERHLNSEPVEACPPSKLYRLGKLARRHKVVLGTASLLAAALMLGITGTTWQALRAHGQSVRAARAERQSAERYRMAKQAVDTYLLHVTQDKHLEQRYLRDLRRRLLESALSFYNRLRKQSPEDGLPEASRAEAIAQLVIVHKELGAFAEATRYCEQAVRIFERLVAADPQNTDLRANLAKSLIRLGELAQLRGASSAERRRYEQQALALRSQLAEERPESALRQHELAMSHSNMGLVTRGDEGYRHIEQAIEIWQKLADRHPREQIYRHYLSLGYHNLAYKAAWEKRGDPLRLHKRGLDLAAQLAKEQPESEEAQIRYAKSHHHVANCLENDLHQFAEARLHREQSVHILREFITLHAHSPTVEGKLASMQCMLALTLRSIKEWTAAREATMAALQTQEKLARDFPADSDYQVSLAGSEANLGVLLRESGLGDEQEALTWLERARERLEAVLERQGPNAKAEEFLNVVYRQLIDLGGHWCNVGNAHLTTSRPHDALNWYQRAIKTLEPVVARQPSVFPGRRNLRNSHRGRSTALAQLGQFDEALQDIDRAIEFDDESLRELRAQRAFILTEIDPVRALLAVEDLLDCQKTSAEDLFKTAGLCLLIAQNTTEQAVRDKCASHSLMLLREAHAERYFCNENRRAQLGDFSELLRGDEFDQLLADVQKAK